jgi:hypothetical protein
VCHLSRCLIFAPTCTFWHICNRSAWVCGFVYASTNTVSCCSHRCVWMCHFISLASMHVSPRLRYLILPNGLTHRLTLDLLSPYALFHVFISRLTDLSIFIRLSSWHLARCYAVNMAPNRPDRSVVVLQSSVILMHCVDHTSRWHSHLIWEGY